MSVEIIGALNNALFSHVLRSNLSFGEGRTFIVRLSPHKQAKTGHSKSSKHWEAIMEYLRAFLCGGILCAVGQILIDKTKLTPARILTGYVTMGVLLGALGIYGPIVQWGGAGATVPLTGFGYLLANGVEKAVLEKGWLGVLTGGLSAAAGGISAAIVFAVVMALIFKPSHKR